MKELGRGMLFIGREIEGLALGGGVSEGFQDPGRE